MIHVQHYQDSSINSKCNSHFYNNLSWGEKYILVGVATSLMWAKSSLFCIWHIGILVRTYPSYDFPVTLLSSPIVSSLTLHLCGPKQGRSLFRGPFLSFGSLHADWVLLSPGKGFPEITGEEESDYEQDMTHLLQRSAASFLLRLRLKVHRLTDVRRRRGDLHH